MGTVSKQTNAQREVQRDLPDVTGDQITLFCLLSTPAVDGGRWGVSEREREKHGKLKTALRMAVVVEQWMRV